MRSSHTTTNSSVKSTLLTVFPVYVVQSAAKASSTDRTTVYIVWISLVLNYACSIVNECFSASSTLAGRKGLARAFALWKRLHLPAFHILHAALSTQCIISTKTGPACSASLRLSKLGDSLICITFGVSSHVLFCFASSVGRTGRATMYALPAYEAMGGLFDLYADVMASRMP